MIIRRIYKEDNSFSHLELVQGQNVIKVSLATTDLDDIYHPEKWDNIVEAVEQHKDSIKDETERMKMWRK